MGLNYELGEIENWQALPDGTVTCVVFATLFVGCPLITEGGKDDWRRVATRVHMWESAIGRIRADGERITPDIIRRFVGLRSNASRMTDSQFRKHLAESAERRAAEAVDRFERKEMQTEAEL